MDFRRSVTVKTRRRRVIDSPRTCVSLQCVHCSVRSSASRRRRLLLCYAARSAAVIVRGKFYRSFALGAFRNVVAELRALHAYPGAKHSQRFTPSRRSWSETHMSRDIRLMKQETQLSQRDRAMFMLLNISLNI